MKIISWLRSPQQPLMPPAEIEMIPDSSIIKDGRPFFVPALSEQWTYSLGLGLRASRLGKCLDRRFARRYFDAFTLCVMPRPVMPEGFTGYPTQLLHAFDGAVIVGQWLDIELLAPTAGIIEAQVSTAETSKACPVDGSAAAMAELLEMVTRHASLKMGDILITSSTEIFASLKENTSVSASLLGNDCLTFRVK